MTDGFFFFAPETIICTTFYGKTNERKKRKKIRRNDKHLPELFPFEPEAHYSGQRNRNIGIFGISLIKLLIFQNLYYKCSLKNVKTITVQHKICLSSANSVTEYFSFTPVTIFWK